MKDRVLNKPVKNYDDYGMLYVEMHDDLEWILMA
jgi:hypothetical protein